MTPSSISILSILHVEGIALGAAGDKFAQHLRHFGQTLQQHLGKFAAAALAKRSELDALMRRLSAAPARTSLEEDGPGKTQHQDRHVVRDLGKIIDEVERAIVG